MDDQRIGRRFEFDREFFLKPKRYRNVTLFQIGELCCERGFEIEPHIQICHEISLILSGEGSFFVNGTEYPVRGGDVFLNRKGELHEIRASQQVKLRYLYIGFTFDGAECDAEWRQVQDFFGNPLSTRLKRDVCDIAAPFLRMLDELYAEPALAQTLVCNYLEQVLVLTYRTFREECGPRLLPQKNVGAVGGTVYGVIRYVDDNFPEIGSVRSVAQNLGYSVAYLSHLFRSKTGMTMQNYITYKKIEKSLSLMDSGRFSITQIARMLHFQTVQSFGKAFKRTLGFSPSVYRVGGQARREGKGA